MRHIGIVVEDINRSLFFYRDLLGLKIKKDIVEEGAYIDTVLGIEKAKVRTVKLSAGNGSLIELLCYSFPVSKGGNKKKISDLGCAHAAFTVADIDMEYRRLSAKGVVFNNPPHESPDGYAKVAFCRDPDGTFIELVEILEGIITLGKNERLSGSDI